MSSPGPLPFLLFLASTDLTYYPPRRLLLHTSSFGHNQPPPGAPPPPPPHPSTAHPAGAAAGEPSSFDANVIMILAVLLCALICAIGLNSVVRCALRCSAAVASSSSSSTHGAGRPSYIGGAPRSCGGTAGGVKKAALKSIPTVPYAADGAGMPCGSSWSECAICLSEFKEGERVRVLPGCNHGFHVGCIDRWLKGNASCPTCRTSCVASCLKKAVSSTGSQAVPPSYSPHPPPPPPPPPQPRASAVSPLDREGVLVEGVLMDFYMARD